MSYVNLHIIFHSHSKNLFSKVAQKHGFITSKDQIVYICIFLAQLSMMKDTGLS